MVGATVGGLLARQRRGELARLNDQLRQINAALRRQAKIESYAPALSYAPVGSKIPESEVIVDPQKERLIAYLRTGKNYLRNQAPDRAFPEFKAALDLAQALGDHVEEKKAARGLGAQPVLKAPTQGGFWGREFLGSLTLEKLFTNSAKMLV
ncbi:hypothetical protein C2845_PM07G11790 [Panicum miliaceum]|uniref:Protein FLUORESCENT IN BLUE LIGHT, chloroplastic-like n=1 Tax=Panicum miliaceum TaxID=4540 RepID=A0A3L6STS2_PANMI|nr:hypothetical protein C2845_PM07G11790 [Panicum miliaceum]